MGKADRAAKRGIERRNYPIKLEVRQAAEGSKLAKVEGYATITDEPFDMWDMFGPYTEIIEGGAFTKTLSENPQVQLLLNHGGISMAYTRAGSLRLAEDSTGLHMSADVNTTRSDVRDMLAAIEDGALDEMSFAFRVPVGKSVWSPDYDQRNIKEVDMHRGDVSVVNFGANYHTEGSLVVQRAADFDRLSDADARALYERLGRRLAPGPAAGLSLSLASAQAAQLD